MKNVAVCVKEELVLFFQGYVQKEVIELEPDFIFNAAITSGKRANCEICDYYTKEPIIVKKVNYRTDLISLLKKDHSELLDRLYKKEKVRQKTDEIIKKEVDKALPLLG